VLTYLLFLLILCQIAYTAGHTKLTNVFRKNENIAFSPSYNAIVAKSNQIFTIFEKDDSDLATTRRDKIMGPPPLPPGPRMGRVFAKLDTLGPGGRGMEDIPLFRGGGGGANQILQNPSEMKQF